MLAPECSNEPPPLDGKGKPVAGTEESITQLGEENSAAAQKG